MHHRAIRSLDVAWEFSNTTAFFLHIFPLFVYFFIQGLVKAVYYTVTHATTTDAAITSVTATVTLSDVPMELSAAASITGKSCFLCYYSYLDLVCDLLH